MNLKKQLASLPLWLKYVAPMAAFLILTTIESAAPEQYHLGFELAKGVVVTGLLLLFPVLRKEIQPRSRVLPLAILVGVAVFVEWVLLDKWIPYPHLGSRSGLDPFAALDSPLLLGLFLAVRFYNLVIMVPVMEELFWRSFLLRYLTNPDFTELAIGTFSWEAFGIVAVAFGLSHSEWLVAILCAAAYALLLRQTRSLFACVVAHGVTNLALGIYIILAQDWIYW